MSAPETPPPLPPPAPQSSGCGTVLAVGAGVVLLLPGLCSVIAIGNFGFEDRIIPLYVLTFLLAVAGALLIVFVVRSESRR
jgi:hypothetical protein